MSVEPRTGWVVGLSMMMGAVLGAVWAHPPGGVHVIVHSQTAAAWTQALGTLMALAIAIFVPWKLHREQLDHLDRKAREAEEKNQLRARLAARAIAMRINSDVADLATQAIYVANVNQSYLGLVKRYKLPDAPIEEALRLPESILNSIEELPNAGPHALEIQRAVALLKMVPQMVAQARNVEDQKKLQERLRPRGIQLTLYKAAKDLATYLDWTVCEFFLGEGSEDLYEQSDKPG